MLAASTGTYQLVDNMDPNLSAVHELRVLFLDTRYFYTVEWRAGKGLFVRLHRFAQGSFSIIDQYSTFLIAGTLETPPPLLPGATFEDPFRGIKIHFISSDSTAATVEVINLLPSSGGGEGTGGGKIKKEPR